MATEYLDKTGLQKLVALIKNRVIPVDKGGTGLTASPSMLVNLASTVEADVMQESPRPGVAGILPLSRGGTGLTGNPAMLVNLASTSADNVLKSGPRPGVTGVLGLANGGTGGNSASAARTKLELHMVKLYNTTNWKVYTNGRFVWICAQDVKTGSGSWDSVTCPYTVPAAYRPGQNIFVPVATVNGASWTGRLGCTTGGVITVMNNGNAGSSDFRNGILMYPMDF